MANANWSPFSTGPAAPAGGMSQSAPSFGVTANSVGQQTMPLIGPTITQAPPQPAPRWSTNPYYASGSDPSKPYANVGKLSVNLADPGALGDQAHQAQGLIEGLLSGVGRNLGGFFGPGAAQTGADIGQGVGHVLQAPLDIAGTLLSHVPAIPEPMGGLMQVGMGDKWKHDLIAQAGNNPWELNRLLQGITPEEWQQKVQTGEVNPIFASQGPVRSLGDQVMQAFGLLGVGSQLLERGWAGGPGDAIKRVMNSPVSELTPEVQQLRDQYKTGVLNHDQFLDRLSTSSAGYSNNWIVDNLLGMVADPTNLLFGAGAAIGFSAKAADLAKAAKFGDLLGVKGAEAGLGRAASTGEVIARGADTEAAAALRESAAKATLDSTGEAVDPAKLTPYDLMKHAQETGQHSDLISQAHNSLDAVQKAALSPAAARMETVANVVQKITDPVSGVIGAIGARGSKPLLNAHLSREATKGVAAHFGTGNFAHVGNEFERLQMGDVFNESAGYFAAQEGLLMSGDSLKRDVLEVHRVMDATPRALAEARSTGTVGTYAARMERWLQHRQADLARLSGGTKEEAMARARTTATDKLQRMGVQAADAEKMIKPLNEKGLNMIDGLYYGYRIKTYNEAIKAAQEAFSATHAGAELSGRAAYLHDTLTRLTLIGPHELTTGRADLLRAAIAKYEDAASTDAERAAAAQTIRDGERQYDRLAYNYLADDGTDAEKITEVKAWLDEHKDTLTSEIDDKTIGDLPGQIQQDAARGDGYIYGLAPKEGEPAWRATYDPETNELRSVNPWIGTVGDAAQPWNLRFHGDGTILSAANHVERSMRFLTQQITADRIVSEAKRSFVEGAMLGFAKPVKGQIGSGLTYREGEDLYQAVATKAQEASTTPRGLTLNEFEDVTKGSAAAARVGMSGRDLQLNSLRAFEGNLGTVGLTQKFTGMLKTRDLPMMPHGAIGQMAERMYPLIRFAYNPMFQLQEWVEPWVFSGARGVLATHAKGWVDPITGKAVTALEANQMAEHLMTRYRAGNPAAQWDTMERTLTYLWGQKAAKDAAAAVDVNMLRRGVGMIGSTHDRKAAASSKMFRYNLGPMLKTQFDKINPNIWLDLERQFGTKDQGVVAMRWLTEKDQWAAADPRIAFHLMDIQKEAAVGAKAAVSLEANAKAVFGTTREALNLRIKTSELDHDTFHAEMLDHGAHPDYIDRAWKQAQFEVKTGGPQQWWDDAVPLVAGGQKEVDAARAFVQAAAKANGITESELMSRTLADSPVSLLHDDLISAGADDVAAWGVLFQQGQDFAQGIHVEPNGAITVTHTPRPEAEAAFLKSVAHPPQDIIDNGLVGRTGDMQKVKFGTGGREVYIPGGEAALRDIETPWTAWEAHVIRAQVLNPNDLKDAALKHALDEKMWRGHTIDMAAPGNLHAIFNNFNFALHSAQMTLTRNEMIGTRFHVRNLTDLTSLAARGRDLANTIRTIEGREPTVNELGLAYGTERHVANHIPLDSRGDYFHDGMLPERTTTQRVKGVMTPTKVKGTEALIKDRAETAVKYLDQTTVAARKRHIGLEAAKLNGPVQNWAIEELAAVGSGGIEDLIQRHPEFGLKRWKSYTEAQRATIDDAAGKLTEALAKGEDDLAARATLAPFVSGTKKIDANVVFKPWNVNGAGLPRTVDHTGKVIHVGNSDLFAYLKNDDVAWRSTGTNGNMGRSLLMAQDMVDHPEHYARRAGEPLDQFGERVSHRTQGLQLKTGFFGADLGDPMNFPKGVHDIHMVGDLTEWMYDRTGGKGPVWDQWFNSLSGGKGSMQELIQKWRAAGAPHGAGTFDWENAAGVGIDFRPGMGEARRLEGASTAEKAAWVRDRIDKAVTGTRKAGQPVFGPEQRDRLYEMYRNDGELAELVGRDITTYGGDYKVFEDTMSERKALAEKTDPYLKRHGNGGYQWKLWDERRHVWDPETTAFASSHALPRRPLRFMASSDDAHNIAGFLDKTGQPSVFDPLGPGYSYLDPANTILHQKDGRMIRGATISLDNGQKIVGLTKYRNRTTFLHEVTHAIIEPLMEPSGRQVVIDDLNRVIGEHNSQLVPGGARYENTRLAAEDAANVLNEATGRAAEARASHVAASAEAKTSATHLKALEAQAHDLVKEVERRQSVFDHAKANQDTLHRLAVQEEKYPLSLANRIEKVDNLVKDAEGELAHATATRDAALSGLQPAREAAATAKSTVEGAKAMLDEADQHLKESTAAHAAATAAHDTVATTALRATKTGWDREVSEHFADEFQKWVATGKAASPQMRDAFAYFRKVLINIYRAAKGQGQQVSPEMDKLFTELMTPAQDERALMANAMPFDATQEAMHGAGMQAVIDAESAAHSNVQFRRSRSWLERSINHPYFGIYPASYMWGKVLPEIVRGLAVNPFGLPIPILTKPVKLGAHEYGLHGTPFWGFVNAQRVWNSVELQKDTDPTFNAQVNDPKNAKVWSALNMLLPATPWDIPANFPLWARRWAESGLQSQANVAAGGQPVNFDLLKTSQDVANYAFGPGAGLGSLADIARFGKAPLIAGTAPQGVGGLTPQQTMIGPPPSVEQSLQGAQQELQQQLPQQPQQP